MERGGEQSWIAKWGCVGWGAGWESRDGMPMWDIPLPAEKEQGIVGLKIAGRTH